MPRDKSISHGKVNQAIKDEFLEKGYEAASIRSIGARAGMTSAGLYRHYEDKAAMFDAIVSPLVSEIRDWTERHIRQKYEMAVRNKDGGGLFGETIMDLIKSVILPRKEEFRLLLNGSKGTRYESFVHDFVKENQKEYMRALEFFREKGYAVRDVSEGEVHMLLSAYLTACFEPIVHEDDDEKILRYLDTLEEFFMPGWLKIMGMN
ncbi:MAG: TetR/AcrR family transcriptional regulator [Clostridiales bacterium]|nr:TetR/AcrR family transcriptional regulator [Clostridiales bacterium]